MKWISVKERLPEEGQICIAKTNCCICFYQYSHDPLNLVNGLFFVPTDGISDSPKFDPSYLTHWMPLPELPND